MHVITRKRLNDFAAYQPESRVSLNRWYQLIKRANARSLSELKQTFPSADQVGKYTVFNLGGNKYRLIAAIHYNRQKVYIRAILTHREYDDGNWKR
ncbi:MAG TPA: type II toxin-antitoxin system HigB family toxin [Pyrinomonadaceae bacterium]|nr:type II toxin-antitoxin system HigB family toxin [Pyrinomonadaceae bacterium]